MDTSTIAAIATPIGSAGIGIIRISGQNALSIAASIFRKSASNTAAQEILDQNVAQTFTSHCLYHGYIVDPDNDRLIDEVLLTSMHAPRSYTREDVVEINSHSGIVVLRNILALVLTKGARLAEPGEFTKRAFINGRIDLTQAEAVIDIINARTDKALGIATFHLKGELKSHIESIRNNLLRIYADWEAAIDFPDDVGEILETNNIIETIRETAIKPLRRLVEQYVSAHIFRDGLVLAVVGRPNVGKSSLMNRLIQKDRVIVSSEPGTTRDFVEEPLNIQGIPIILADTAGLHETNDPVEIIGIKKTREYIDGADLILFMIEACCELTKEDYFIYESVKDKNVILVLNKSDLVTNGFFPQKPKSWNQIPNVTISALYNKNIEALKDLIVAVSTGDFRLEGCNRIIPNLRHKLLLDRSLQALSTTVDGLQAKTPVEFIVIDLKGAIDSLGEIIGLTVREDVLDQIFSRFCIGK